MLVEIEAVKFALLRNTKRAGQIHNVHQQHRRAERSRGYDGATDELRFQEREPSVVEEAREWSGIVRPSGTRCPELTRREQAEGKRSPYAAQAMYRYRADWIIDAQPLEQLNAQADHNTGNATENDGARGADPVAGASNGNEAG